MGTRGWILLTDVKADGAQPLGAADRSGGDRQATMDIVPVLTGIASSGSGSSFGE